LPALAEQGVELLAWMSPEQAERCTLRGVRAVPVPEAPPLTWRGQRAIARAIARERVDLVHFPHLDVPRGLRRPHVVTVHDLIPLRISDPTRPAWKRLAFRWVASTVPRRATRVFTVSHHTRRDLESFLGMQAGRILVTPPGVEDRFFVPVPDEAIADLRTRMALPGPFVLVVGQTKPHKNLELLLEVFESLGERHPGLRLVLVGEPDPASRLEERILARGVAARVRLLGRVEEDDLHGLFAAATCLAFPSRYEGFGLPPLEAMAHGTPVLASSATSVPEVVGDAGLLLDPGDVLEWRSALERILESAEWRDALRSRGQARARTFRWSETARLTIDGYRAALGLLPGDGRQGTSTS
jgi:glycosyltransferase involved in cell wall biosynthesis